MTRNGTGYPWTGFSNHAFLCQCIILFVEKNVFCLVFVNQIKLYLCDQNSDEVKQIKSLDYNKILINNSTN